MISPSERQIDSLKKISEEDFYVVADDQMYYSSKLIAYLDSMRIKITHRLTTDRICFKIQGGHYAPFAISDLMWETLVYDGVNVPKTIDVIDYNADIDRIFKK
jgi:hypothetical protein